LRIQLLGPFEVWRDGQLLLPIDWPGRKARQLLKILVTHRERVVATDALIEWLWPGLTPASARNSLWVSVSRLRRLLEPEMAGQGNSTFLLTADPGYRFDPGDACEIDVQAYLDHVTTGRWHERQGAYAPAIDAYLASEALYHGGYLPEDPYDDWAIPDREGLRETWLEAKVALARCHLVLGRYAGSLASARDVLGQDPCRETAWRLVMEAHYRSGERDQALLTFERSQAVWSQAG
jgi:DNA-binding SARP family transcriptional activator